jgi:hypothetical protein
MKTFSITALLAVILVANSAQAQFGNSNGQNIGQINQGQQQFGGQQQQTRRRGRITPELIQGIIGLFDGGQQTGVNNRLNLAGTWNETLNGFQLQHTMSANNFHQIVNRNTGRQTNSQQAQFDGNNLQLLNGRYAVAEVSPGVLQLRNFKETRTWTRINTNNGGGFGGGNGGGGVLPPPQNSGLPQQLRESGSTSHLTATYGPMFFGPTTTTCSKSILEAINRSSSMVSRCRSSRDQ